MTYALCILPVVQRVSFVSTENRTRSVRGRFCRPALTRKGTNWGLNEHFAVAWRTPLRRITSDHRRTTNSWNVPRVDRVGRLHLFVGERAAVSAIVLVLVCCHTPICFMQLAFQSTKCDDYQIAGSTLLLHCYHGLCETMDSIAVYCGTSKTTGSSTTVAGTAR